MGRPHQINKVDRYAVVLPPTSVVEGLRGRQEEGLPWEEELLLREIMMAIKDLKGTLEPKLDAVTIDIALLRADYQKLSEKDTSTESTVSSLQNTTKPLEEKVDKLEKAHIQMEACLEDQEGRVCRNNIRIMWVPEKAEGPSVELFVE
ncbi:hypothetical protein NDU88_000256 [Pleurodeles waltl]|uniref:Uncharacterized protein n=1 Tax=Pleurodeles waltl TaxID=8319 RepID=A0AAV7VWU9_PLEWA|nr:hypothetical protein NDU88_000256 [Pleurodeles waltl]